MIDRICNLVFLLVCSITDIRERRINIMLCALNVFTSVVIKMCLGQPFVENMVSGILIGIVFFIINRISKSGIGMGDVYMITAMACVCGAIKAIEILFWGCVVCMLFSLVFIVIGKMNLKSKLPFAPFVLVGDILFAVI